MGVLYRKMKVCLSVLDSVDILETVFPWHVIMLRFTYIPVLCGVAEVEGVGGGVNVEGVGVGVEVGCMLAIVYIK